MIAGFYSAAISLYSDEIALKAISNDIANMNTTGYKASDVRFSDIYYQALTGASRVSQTGKGGYSESVKISLVEGPIKTTESSTDVAIVGDGFFVVKDPKKDKLLFTRDGTFILDKDKKLVTVDGLPVQGVIYTEVAALTPGTAPTYTDIDLSGMETSFKPTTQVDLMVNLDASIKPEDRTFDIGNPEETADFITSVDIYDQEGNPTHLFFAFDKVDLNTWSLQVLKREEDGGFTPVGSPTTLRFNPGGLLEEGSSIVLDIDGQEVNVSLSGSTQFASRSSVFYSSQDGYPLGKLSFVYVNSYGEVVGRYSNGQDIPLARIVLARFRNPWDLERVGNNRFSNTYLSGDPQFFFPSDEKGYAKVVGGALEMSNVDLAREFADLIATQWSFSANARVLRTADEMLLLAVRRNL